MQPLASRMRLIPQGELQTLAKQTGFIPEKSRTILSPGDKPFSVDEFRFWSDAPAGSDDR
jgi:hypothetical protein